MKKFFAEQKIKLEKAKNDLEKELRAFARPDSQIKNNWETKVSDFGVKTADPSEEEDQTEEYEANLSIEYTLETRLKKINQALERIKKGTSSDGGTYGICQKCRKKIQKNRLEAEPEADLCIKCTAGGSEK